MYLNTESFRNADTLTTGLTLTWDVFKLKFSFSTCLTDLWLTLTWDVFKCK